MWVNSPIFILFNRCIWKALACWTLTDGCLSTLMASGNLLLSDVSTTVSPSIYNVRHQTGITRSSSCSTMSSHIILANDTNIAENPPTFKRNCRLSLFLRSFNSFKDFKKEKRAGKFGLHSSHYYPGLFTPMVLGDSSMRSSIWGYYRTCRRYILGHVNRSYWRISKRFHRVNFMLVWTFLCLKQDIFKASTSILQGSFFMDHGNHF